MTDVRIYRPAKAATQSGRGKTGPWILEPELPTRRGPEPVMGWTASGDTLNQVKLRFDSAEDAIAYAQEKGWAFTISQANDRRVRPRNYVDNFRYVPVEER